MRRILLVLAIAIPTAALAVPKIQGCPIMPADNVWNAPVNTLPVHPNSASYLATMNATKSFHMDFGSGLYLGNTFGIPFNVVPGSQPRVPVAFDVPDESDPGPYPIPPGALVEGYPNPDPNSDQHVLILDKDNCVLYETYFSATSNGGASWTAFSGAKFDLRSNELRPDTFTSADAAGLPILPGLVRYDEAAAGLVGHALRFTMNNTANSYVWPAKHMASNKTTPFLPPMGLRLRMKASVNIAGLAPRPKAIAQAMKTYGIILADNGSDWFVSGTQDDLWDNNELSTINSLLRGSDFEVVDTSSMIVNLASGKVANPACGTGDTDGDGVPDCVDVTEGLNPAVKDNDVFGNSRLFAMQQYRDFLSREGDAAGIHGWTDTMQAGTARAAVVESFFNSAEFQGVIAPVARLYFAYFLRIPDYGGLTFWINYYRAGNALAAVSQAFATSQEFVDRYGALDNPQFVDLVYQNVLGRAADAGGRAFWLGQLNGGMTRGAMMIGFSESPEYKAAIASEVYVTMMYVGMLRRAPDTGGFNFWMGYIDAGNSGQTLIGGFLGAPEYHNRFLP